MVVTDNTNYIKLQSTNKLNNNQRNNLYIFSEKINWKSDRYE